jgi:hypothetical protein
LFVLSDLIFLYIDMRVYTGMDPIVVEYYKRRQVEWLEKQMEAIKAKSTTPTTPSTKAEIRKVFMPSVVPPAPVAKPVTHGQGKGFWPGRLSLGHKAPRTQTSVPEAGKKRKDIDDDVFEETTQPVTKKARVIPKKKGILKFPFGFICSSLRTWFACCTRRRKRNPEIKSTGGYQVG